jgi:outer membrane protein assembly factor BamB
MPLDIELDLGGRDSIIYDLAVAPDTTTVYAAGRFGAHGAENLIAFDGLTGEKLRSYITPPLYSVHDDGTVLWAGGRHLLRVLSPERMATVVTASTKRARRDPQILDIVSAPQGGVFIACRCERLDGRRVGSFAHVRTNGAVERDWDPARLDTASVGRKVLVDSRITYLAAGGSDYVQAVRTTTGRSLWKTDTNGQVQAVASFEDRLVIGGHWRIVQSYCQPRLAALDPDTGDLDRAWTPAPNPDYAGVWALTVSSDGSLWAGGRFERLGSDWLRNGLACEYIDGDQTRPRAVEPNAWARSFVRLT